MAYNRRHRTAQRTTSRWMTLRYAGKCKVCQRALQAGELAFWDSATKTVTCHDIECCDADGLTTIKPLTGPWDKRTDTRERLEKRLGAPAPRVIVATFNSGESAWVNANGRCEDAPCCGCCS